MMKKKNYLLLEIVGGEDWGDKDYGYLPYEYVCDKDLASDFWIVNKVC